MASIPIENQRVKKVIDFTTNGNVLQFSKEIGISQPRINRLFTIDSRNGKYPLISFEIAQAIINKFVNVNAEWLLLGNGEMLKTNIVAELNNDCNHYKELAEERAYTIQMQRQVIENLQQELKQHKKNTQSTMPDVLHQSTR